MRTGKFRGSGAADLRASVGLFCILLVILGSDFQRSEARANRGVTLEDINRKVTLLEGHLFGEGRLAPEGQSGPSRLDLLFESIYGRDEEALVNRLRKVQGDLETLESAVNGLVNGQKALEEDVGVLMENLANQGTQISELRDDVETLYTKDEVDDEIESAIKGLISDEIDKSNKELKDAIASLARSLDTVKQRVVEELGLSDIGTSRLLEARIYHQLHEIGNELQAVNGTLRSHNGRLESVEKRVTPSNEVSEEKKNLPAQIVELRSNLGNLETKILGASQEAGSGDPATATSPTSLLARVDGVTSDLQAYEQKTDENFGSLKLLVGAIAVIGLVGLGLCWRTTMKPSGASTSDSRWMTQLEAAKRNRKVDSRFESVEDSLRHVLHLHQTEGMDFAVHGFRDMPIIGREGQVESLRARIVDQNLYIFGRARVGKTALMKRLRDDLLDPPGQDSATAPKIAMLPVYLDLREPDIQPIFHNLLGAFEASVFDFLRFQGDELLDAKLTEELQELTVKTADDFTDCLLLLDERTREGGQICCVFLLDGLDKIAEVDGVLREEFLSFLKSTAESPHRNCRILGSGQSSWHSVWKQPPVKVVEMELKGMSRQGTKELIAAGYPYQYFWRDSAVETLHDFCEGVPGEIRRLATMITEKAMSSLELQIDPGFVRKILRQEGEIH